MNKLLLLLCGGLVWGCVAESVTAQTIRFGRNRTLKEVSMDWLVDKADLFQMTPDDLEKTAGSKHFTWQDKERTRARFNPDKYEFKIKGKDVGEVLLNFKSGKLASVTVSVLNKGDENGIIDKTMFTAGVDAVKEILGAASGAKEEPRRKDEMVSKAEGAVWRSKKALYIGEWLFLPLKKEEIDGWIWTTKEHGEFVRMRIYPPEAVLGLQLTKPKVTVTRAQLAGRVKREGKKAVIQNIPMVDQGSKGYCAVASFERVLRYYGADIDMHDLANIAETYGGTSPENMKSAVQRISQKLAMRTREPFFLKHKQYELMFKDYNKVAKKEGKNEVNLERGATWEEVDPGTLKKSRGASPDALKFKQEVFNNINAGIPIMWALELGLFWEDKIEESYEANRYAVSKDKTDEEKEDEDDAKKLAEEDRKEAEEMRKKNPRPPSYMGGGHMRLIVGYDLDKQVIFYTDSWGPGHELKQMPIDEAIAVTLAMFVLEPQ